MCDSSIEVSDTLRLVKDPLVSVIMVTYNHERYLAEAIEGVVRQQTSFPIELLIGDDCSTDGTRKVALDYQMRFPELIRVVVSAQNVGAGKNFARLIAASRGKYMAFCEGDDFWHRPDKLSRQVAALEADPCVSMVCSNHRLLSDAGHVLKEHYHRPLNTFGEQLYYDDLVLGKSSVSTLTVCARRTLVQAAFRESPQCRDARFLMGDLPLWLELSRSGKVHYLPESLASYRLSLNSATRSKDPSWSRKFAMSVYEVRYQFLEIHPLRAGLAETREQQAKLTRRCLFEAAIVGKGNIAALQIRRLRKIPGALQIQSCLLYVLAYVPIARRISIPILNSLQRKGRRLITIPIRNIATVLGILRTPDK
jgi:glycosyltransferase involved in cell wall biosynthesis